MKKLIFAGIAGVVLLSVCISGCIGAGSTDVIVGTWHSEDSYSESGIYYDLKYVFNSDGTGTEYWYLSSTNEFDDSYGFTWKNNGNNVYTVSYNGYDSSYDEPFYLSGSKLSDDYDVTYYKS
jgi:hypothetical protein